MGRGLTISRILAYGGYSRRRVCWSVENGVGISSRASFTIQGMWWTRERSRGRGVDFCWRCMELVHRHDPRLGEGGAGPSLSLVYSYIHRGPCTVRSGKAPQAQPAKLVGVEQQQRPRGWRQELHLAVGGSVEMLVPRGLTPRFKASGAVSTCEMLPWKGSECTVSGDAGLPLMPPPLTSLR